MRRLSRRTLLAWAGLGAVAPACLSPTLPLPPPEVPDARDLGNGTYQLEGTLPIFATVIVRNRRTARGQVAGPTIDYSFIVEAQKGDVFTIWYETDAGDISSQVPFQIDRLTPIVPDGGTAPATPDGGSTRVTPDGG